MTPGLCCKRFESWWWRPLAPQGPSTWCPSLVLCPATPPLLNFLVEMHIMLGCCHKDGPVEVVGDLSRPRTFQPGSRWKSPSHGCHHWQPTHHVSQSVLKWDNIDQKQKLHIAWQGFDADTTQKPKEHVMRRLIGLIKLALSGLLGQ